MNRPFAMLRKINAVHCSGHTGGLWFCSCVHEWGVRNEWVVGRLMTDILTESIS